MPPNDDILTQATKIVANCEEVQKKIQNLGHVIGDVYCSLPDGDERNLVAEMLEVYIKFAHKHFNMI